MADEEQVWDTMKMIFTSVSETQVLSENMRRSYYARVCEGRRGERLRRGQEERLKIWRGDTIMIQANQSAPKLV